jgi:subtilisin family serine protease
VTILRDFRGRWARPIQVAILILFSIGLFSASLFAKNSLSLDLSLDKLNPASSNSALTLPTLSHQLALGGLRQVALSDLTLSSTSNNEIQFSPSSESVNPVAKLDPLLRVMITRQQQGQALSTFAPMVAVYSAQDTPISHPVVMSELGPYSQSIARSTMFTQNVERMGVLISMNGSPTSLRQLGVDVFDGHADVVSARVTFDQLVALSRLPEIEYIEASTVLVPDLDKSISSVQGDLVQRQSPSADGTGVFVTAIDTGIDWTHEDFRFDRNGDNIEESSRIAYIWDQTLRGSGFGLVYGVEYTREHLESDLRRGLGFDEGQVLTRDENGHGTHVAGIQGGDGSAADSDFIGMAPGATLGFVKTTFASGDIIDAVTYLFDRGRKLDMPTVVNLSLGGHFGPHDGRSAFERALDSLSGPGRIIVNSAGNEGNDAVHVSDTLSENNDTYSVNFTADGEVAALSFWYDGDASFSVDVETPGFGDEVETFTANQGQMVIHTWVGESTITIDNASQGKYPFNGDQNLLIVLDGVEPESVWTVTLTYHAGPGRFDGWVGLGSFGQFSKSDPSMTISEPGNAKRVITVGAYVSKTRWDSILGQNFSFARGIVAGGIAPFSSSGPTRDGRIKPDLMAPGTAVVSTLAAESSLTETLQLVAPDGVHAALQGTSMASPHVGGTVALMLQADPMLDQFEIIRRLRGSATGDLFTHSLPNPAWGFGKLNTRQSVDSVGLPLPIFGDSLALKLGVNNEEGRVNIFYVLPQSTNKAEVHIFDALGHPLRTLQLNPVVSRQGWDLRDDQGRRIGHGLYIAVIVADGRASKPQPLVIGSS